MRDKHGRFIKGHRTAPEVLALIVEANKARSRPHVEVKCETCGKMFEVWHYRAALAKFCGQRCKRWVAKVHYPRKSTQGYMFIQMRSFHRANKDGYAKLADLVLENKIGRPLKPGEIAHHIDHCKTNDDPDNLQLMTKHDHDAMHLAEIREMRKAA